LYTYEGKIQTKHPIDSQDISLAHIDANLITPPHTTNSVKHFISRYEGDPTLALGNLFNSLLSDHPMNNDYISILSRDGPGCRPEQPMAIVRINDQDDDLAPHPQENDGSVPTSQEEYSSKIEYDTLQITCKHAAYGFPGSVTYYGHFTILVSFFTLRRCSLILSLPALRYTTVLLLTCCVLQFL
jgi:hypothetical protein